MVACAKRANVEMSIAGESRFGSERFDPPRTAYPEPGRSVSVR
jgi:hypothetical protein